MDLLLDVVSDTVRLIPFLFVTYLLLTYAEHKDEVGFHRLIRRYQYLGPALGAVLGIVPQCGFSVMAACLYLDSSISIGTLTAVFLSTSDEAIPMLLAQPESFDVLWKLILAKVVLGMALGYVVDVLTHVHFHASPSHEHDAHMQCDGIWKETLQRTGSVTLYIFLFSLLLALVMEHVSAEHISAFMSNLGIGQPLLCALIGFIPNCASSVLLCELFLHGFISAGSLFCGLCCNAGLGFMILLRARAWKAMACIAGVVLVASLGVAIWF